MFGLFSSKSEKLVKKAYKIHREYFASMQRVLDNPDSNFWLKYCVETELHLKDIGKEIYKEKGQEYLNNLLNNLEIEQKNSKYQFTKKKKDILFKRINK